MSIAGMGAIRMSHCSLTKFYRTNCSNKPYALALCLLSIFSIFIVELLAFRWGTSKLAKLGITYGPWNVLLPYSLLMLPR